ncbi:MAG TPA: hypothetical protein VE377_00690 [Candidatus Dormibacteraeota bacterium]|nr:hypothetical protein [Candidatus Dormibacteraeota bacterium]
MSHYRNLHRIATVVGLVLSVSLWAQDAPQGAHKPKLAELNDLGDMISVDGFWEPDNPTKQNEVVPTAVHIECFRHGGKGGNLTRTEAFCVVATAMAPTGILMADFSFQGASWSDDEIVISDDSPICLINKTFFDLKRKTVTGLDIRKPEAKGFANSCKLLPDRQSYYLRDRVDYALFHEPVKK